MFSFQIGLRLPDRRQPALPPGQLRRQLIPATITVDSVLSIVGPLRVGEQCLDLGGYLLLKARTIRS